MNDNFTTAATAEARRESPLYDNEVLSYGVRMAEWARDHLAAQEPTDADTDALTERIRRARSVPAEWARLREGESTREQIERHHRRMDEQTAALVAAEVHKAKAEAWDEGYQAKSLDETQWVLWGRVQETVNPYSEAGDSDEHR